MATAVATPPRASELRDDPLEAPPPPAVPRPEPRFWPAVDESSGLVVEAGYGYQVGGGAGFAVSYQFAVTPSWHLSPRAGAGPIFVDDLPTVAYAAGSTLAWGRNHRLLLDVGWGMVAASRGPAPGPGRLGPVREVHAASAGVGYEYLAPFGLFARGLVAGGIDTSGPDAGAPRPLYSLMVGLKVY